MRGMILSKRKKIIRIGIAGLLVIILVWNLIVTGEKEKPSFSLTSGLFKMVQETVMETVFPFASFQTGERQAPRENWLEEGVLLQIPFASYAMAHGNLEEITEDGYFYDLLLEEQKQAAENSRETISEAVIEDEDTDDILAGMEAENEAVTKQMEEMIRNENAMVAKKALEAQKEAAKDFSQALEKKVQYDWSLYTSADSLLKDFYAVDSTTKADADLINLDKLLNRDLTIDKNTEGYQILIYHTHSQEAFADSIPGDKSTTVVGAGERLTQILTEQYGYKVLHHTGEYDVEYRDDAYSKALPEIEKVLAENPEIQVVIDLHRDEVAEGTKLVTDLQGRPTARFMFFNGLSYTRQIGKIGYLENENLEGNLAFSFQMQAACNEYFPGLTRRIYLKGYRYNMHLKERCLLVELGAQNNTVEEIMNACDPLAQALDMVLSGMVY